jgi:hypothetical protein
MNTDFSLRNVRALGLWSGFALLLGVVALMTNQAAAQQDTAAPSSGPLPTIIYPSHTAKAAPSDFRLPAAEPVPEPDCTLDDTCQIPYVVLGGYWGFWDRNRRFHRVSAAHVRAMRGRAFAYHTVAFAHGGSFGGGRANR